MVATSEIPEWEETLTSLSQGVGSVMVLGGTDTGKTTFARHLLNRCLQVGQSVAILDADPGQSEVGPPTCLGLAFPEKEVLSISDLSAHALAFVGRTTPQGGQTEYLSALLRLTRLLEGRRLIVDMSGYIQGEEARLLYHTLFDLLSPAHVVALERRGELSAIVAPLQQNDLCTLHTPTIPSAISRKPAQFRALRRSMRFAGYFQEATQHSFAFDDLAMVGTWLGGGSPVPAHILKYLGQAVGMERRVYYAEMWGSELGMMLNAPLSPHSPALGQITQHLKVQSVTLTVAPHLKYLLVGLEDGKGRLLGVGSLTALDFRRRTLGVVATLRASGAVRAIRFGAYRAMPDGTEKGAIPRLSY